MAKKKTQGLKKKAAAKTKAPVKAPPVKEVEAHPKPRQQTKKYSSFRLQKRIKADQPVVLGSFKILKKALGTLRNHWKVFVGMAIIYGIFNVILVQSFASLNINDTKQALEGAFAGDWNKFMSGFSLFTYLVGASGSTNTQTAGAYQFSLLLITSLAAIWTLRHVYQGQTVRLRDAYYKGMYPVIPFLLVLAALAIQMVPLAFGSFLYSFAGGAGALTGTEMALWIAALFMLLVVSFYMISSTVFALYVVCLPEVAPMTALRSARALVRHRRWTVMRRLLFLPFALFAISAVIMVPIIMFLTPIAVWVFFVLTMMVIPVAHAYMYSLYRELL